MSKLTKLSSKLFSLTGTKNHQDVPLAMCSNTLVETDPNFRGVRCGTKLPENPGLKFELLKEGKNVTPADICKIKKQIYFAKEMHKIESDQYDFFHDNSRYLEVNNEVLVLLAPDPVVEEQLALFKREKNLRLKMRQGSQSCFKCKFLYKIKKSQKSSKDLSKEYEQLKREYLSLINDKSDKLKVIAFLTVVFSCRNNMIDETIPLRNQDG